MNNNLPVIKEESGFFTKIKMFFKTLFKLNNNAPNYNLAVEQGGYMNIKNNDFSHSLRVEENLEEKELLKLQEKFESGLVTEEELTEEQVDKLEQLYNEQIDKLNKDFLNYKNRILSIKKQLA